MRDDRRIAQKRAENERAASSLDRRARCAALLRVGPFRLVASDHRNHATFDYRKSIGRSRPTVAGPSAQRNRIATTGKAANTNRAERIRCSAAVSPERAAANTKA